MLLVWEAGEQGSEELSDSDIEEEGQNEDSPEQGNGGIESTVRYTTQEDYDRCVICQPTHASPDPLDV